MTAAYIVFFVSVIVAAVASVIAQHFGLEGVTRDSILSDYTLLLVLCLFYRKGKEKS